MFLHALLLGRYLQMTVLCGFTNWFLLRRVWLQKPMFSISAVSKACYHIRRNCQNVWYFDRLIGSVHCSNQNIGLCRCGNELWNRIVKQAFMILLVTLTDCVGWKGQINFSWSRFNKFELVKGFNELWLGKRSLKLSFLNVSWDIKVAWLGIQHVTWMLSSLVIRLMNEIEPAVAGFITETMNWFHVTSACVSCGVDSCGRTFCELVCY